MRHFLSVILVCFSFSIGLAQSTLIAYLTLPKQVGEKQSFTEYLIIEKPANLRSYAVFTQQFPEGFYVKTKTVQGASISFKKNILTVTWMRLPSDKFVRVPVKISFKRGLTGTFSLSGNLTYIVDNKQGKIDLHKKYISVISEDISGINNLDEYTNHYTTFQNVECFRNIKHSNDSIYSVELKLNNISDLDKFIITEEASRGFEILQNANTKLTSNNRIAQFEIKNSDKKNNYILKYQLISGDVIRGKEPVIFGKISFLYKGKIITILIQNRV